MKPTVETLAHLVVITANIYLRLGMYAKAPGELDGVLFHCRGIWGFISERHSEMMTTHGQLCSEDYGGMTGSESFWDQIVYRHGIEGWELPIDHWKKVDQISGLNFAAWNRAG
jgi:hypothetical protein